eukprot:TRINITY_DN38963_c0_g1_i1.p1 TRINITY_DN38963_c0_g1~~TRINITY_DN38963_c0_g1_i1.p1  ORF type:complete len:1005 (-),score=144.83 TRINITY_DN38963_c0_g1_i1:136-3150(-)
MAWSADQESAVCRQVAKLVDIVGEEVLEYVNATVISLLDDNHEKCSFERELAEFLGPYFEGSNVDIVPTVSSITNIAFPVVESVTEETSLEKPICHIHNLFLMYGGGNKPLLNNTHFELRRGHRYGVIGSNGSGKTSLMSKIADGTIDGFSHLSCCHLRYDAILSGIDPAISCTDYIASRRAFMGLDAGREEDLSKFGFDEYMCSTSIGCLSGGWRMRLALACALMEYADVYLLDEPTNHLDTAGVDWLQDYLVQDEGRRTSLIISHDRAFLNYVCTDIIHFTPEGKLVYYVGNFDAFCTQSDFDFASANTTFAISGRDEVARAHPSQEPSNKAMVFPRPGREGWVGNALLTLTGCNFRFSLDKPLALKEVTLQVGMNSRVGVYGPNGAGKSTLLNLLAGELLPLDNEGDIGSLARHPQLRFAYVAQQHFFHLAEFYEYTPVQYIQARFANGWDAETQRRLVLPQTCEAIQYRKDMAAKYGGKPFYWDESDLKWKGREVARVLGRSIKGKQALYEVEWKRVDKLDQLEATHETAEKLRLLGVEMLCLAIDSRSAYADMALRPLTTKEIVCHLKGFGISEHMSCNQRLGSFSDGQKSKLMFAGAMWVKPHLLLVDEPTNFLDMQTVCSLVDAIKSFRGGTVVVSHNSDFLSKTCNELWRVEDGRVLVHGKEARTERLNAKQRQEREKQERARQRLGPSVGWEMDVEKVGLVLKPEAICQEFERFVGTPLSLPEHAVQYAVQTFLDVGEERKPKSSEEWLAVVIAALHAVESIGFSVLENMEYMAPVAVAFLRALLRTRALGATDGGEALVFSQVHTMRALRARGHRVATAADRCRALWWREVASIQEECCYCGQSLDSARLENHRASCPMSPDRCGRRLGDALTFEMFHGTSESAAAKIEQHGFEPSVSGMLGPGVYCSRELRKARAYGSVVLLLHVYLGRVIKIDRKDHPLKVIWQTPVGGLFDCAWVPPNCGVVGSGLEENCIRSPCQITVVRRVKWDEKAVF